MMKRNLVKSMTLMVLILCLLMGTVSNAAAPNTKNVSVLMIGNSLTMRKNNTTIKHLKALAKKGGYHLTVKYVASGGEKLKNWANPKNKNGKKAYKAINSRKWDYVVLQENTDYAIFKGKSLLNSSKKLASYIHKKNPETQIVYNATWCYKKSRKSNSQKTQQHKINMNYQNAANAAGGIVSWSGQAFMEYRATKHAKELYLKDKNHGSKYGWYLNACCLYATIFQANPTDTKYTGGLNKKHAIKLQNIAFDVNQN